MVVNDEGNEMNLDKSKERHIGKFSYTPKESIENKGDGFVQSLIESDNAEVEEISVEEKSTHTFLYTCTPKKRKLQCEGCNKESQCDDYVENYLTKKKLTN